MAKELQVASYFHDGRKTVEVTFNNNDRLLYVRDTGVVLGDTMDIPEAEVNLLRAYVRGLTGNTQ